MTTTRIRLLIAATCLTVATLPLVACVTEDEGDAEAEEAPAAQDESTEEAVSAATGRCSNPTGNVGSLTWIYKGCTSAGGKYQQYYCSSSLSWQPTRPYNYKYIAGCGH